jgi:hypothetical protein
MAKAAQRLYLTIRSGSEASPVRIGSKSRLMLASLVVVLSSCGMLTVTNNHVDHNKNQKVVVPAQALSGISLKTCGASGNSSGSVGAGGPGSQYLYNGVNGDCHPAAVAIKGNYAYVLSPCGSNCYTPFEVVDLSTPATPKLVGGTELSWGSSGIAVQGSYAYTTGYDANPNFMRAVDVTDPTNPNTAAAYTDSATTPQAIAVNGQYAYMVDYGGNNPNLGTSGNPNLSVIDISNLSKGAWSPSANTSNSSLTRVGQVGTGAGTSAIALAGKYAYVVNAVDDNLQVVDISTPSNPRIAGTTASLGPTGQSSTAYSGVSVVGSWAYVSNYNTNSLQVIDVSDPSHPKLVADISAGRHPDAIAVQNGYAYVANYGSSTLQIFDLSTADKPASLGTVATDGGPKSVAVSGQYVFVANYDGGTLQVFDTSGSGSGGTSPTPSPTASPTPTTTPTSTPSASPTGVATPSPSPT